MNTKICYMYRDAANYKVHNEYVVNGELTSADEKEVIGNCLIDGEYFYPASVGLPARDFVSIGYRPYEDDPDWFEFQGFEATHAAPTGKLTAAELMAAFRAGKGKKK